MTPLLANARAHGVSLLVPERFCGERDALLPEGKVEDPAVEAGAESGNGPWQRDCGGR